MQYACLKYGLIAGVAGTLALAAMTPSVAAPVYNGATAVKAYRKPIPLSKTQNNYHHFGEPGPKLDRKLNDDLMNGLFMQYEKRYKISDLDLAILSDCGLPIRK